MWVVGASRGRGGTGRRWAGERGWVGGRIKGLGNKGGGRESLGHQDRSGGL